MRVGPDSAPVPTLQWPLKSLISATELSCCMPAYGGRTVVGVDDEGLAARFEVYPRSVLLATFQSVYKLHLAARLPAIVFWKSIEFAVNESASSFARHWPQMPGRTRC